MPSGERSCFNTYGYAPRIRRKFGSTSSANPSRIVRLRIMMVMYGGILNLRTLSLEISSNSICSNENDKSDDLFVPPVAFFNAFLNRGTRMST